MKELFVNFNEPVLFDSALQNIKNVFIEKHASGDGKYTKLCNMFFEQHYNFKKPLVVHSGTAALEMAAMLINLTEGDEVIMPSYTFCSTANAFVLQGAIPVFVDIRADTLNIDEKLIEQAITSKTKAIVVVHYAGISCEMDVICEIAKKHNLYVIEDAAQAFSSKYKGRYLGTIGDIGCMSFHETKNIMSGEGGLVVINNEIFNERAEIIREKGTNRSKFFRGQVDKYTWVDKGSSYLPSDIISAYLYSNLRNCETIQEKRISLWNRYNEAFIPLEKELLVRRPIVPTFSSNNAHMYYLICRNLDERTKLIEFLNKKNISCVFHYVPLHSSPAGIKFCRVGSDMTNTNDLSDRLVRLPLFFDLSFELQDEVIKAVLSFFL